MANIICSSKSSSDWTPNELITYNIRVVYQDFILFFGTPNYPDPQINKKFSLCKMLPLCKATIFMYTFLCTMDLAMSSHPGKESAVDDFTIILFGLLRYTGRAVGQVTRTRKDLLFWVCDEERYAKKGVCIIDNQDILLLVQEDKWHLDHTDPELQLIEEGITAFHNNNNMCV